MGERGVAIPAVIADLIGPPTFLVSSLSTTTASNAKFSPMGSSSTKSVARVYADVNTKLGPSWHEYGAILIPFVGLPLLLLISHSKAICRSSGDLRTTTRSFRG